MMARAICPVLLFPVVLLVLSGCGGGDKDPKAAVDGTVNLDGKPLPEGEISFHIAGKAPVTLPISNGAFSGEVPTGKHKVTFGVYKEDMVAPFPGEKPIPTKTNTLHKRYHGDSKLEEEIKPEGTKGLKYDLKSK